MKNSWQQYQEAAAAVFRRMGLNAEVDKDVPGVRAKHAIDVYVSGSIHGLGLKWVVECKAWKSNVPKEKVLALLSIVQDIGADKGILLSEIGFQSGAIKAARGTNVMLASVADLSEQLELDFKESILKSLSWRLQRVTKRLQALNSEADDYVWTPQHEQQMKLFALAIAFHEAIEDRFPVIYAIGKGDERLKAADFDTLVREADLLLCGAEGHCDKAEKEAESGAAPNGGPAVSVGKSNAPGDRHR